MWERLPAGLRTLLLLAALAGSIAAINQLRGYYAPQARAPGIVDLELAGDADRARYVLDTFGGMLMQQTGPRVTWEPFRPSIQGWGRRRAADHTRIDYVFIPCYAVTLLLGCAWTAAEFRKLKQDGPGRLADRIALLQPIAGLCDAAENVGLLAMIGGRFGPWPAVTAVLASIKFAIVALGVMVFAAGVVLATGKLLRGDLPAVPRPRLVAAYLIAAAVAFAAITFYALTQVETIAPPPMPPEPRAVT